VATSPAVPLTSVFREDVAVPLPHRRAGAVRNDEHDERDPTALVYVDRVMKRLGFSPTNPDSAPYDDMADD
jgi:hypothetical protein